MRNCSRCCIRGKQPRLRDERSRGAHTQTHPLVAQGCSSPPYSRTVNRKTSKARAMLRRERPWLNRVLMGSCMRAEFQSLAIGDIWLGQAASDSLESAGDSESTTGWVNFRDREWAASPTWAGQLAAIMAGQFLWGSRAPAR